MTGILSSVLFVIHAVPLPFLDYYHPLVMLARGLGYRQSSRFKFTLVVTLYLPYLKLGWSRRVLFLLYFSGDRFFVLFR